jgi:hypothetical protein
MVKKGQSSNQVEPRIWVGFIKRCKGYLRQAWSDGVNGPGDQGSRANCAWGMKTKRYSQLTEKEVVW